MDTKQRCAGLVTTPSSRKSLLTDTHCQTVSLLISLAYMELT